jgi:quinol monooxygenase YgiN
VIIYEVNLFVRRQVEAEFRAWLELHVQEILALPGFVSAEVFERIEPDTSADEFALCTQYRLHDAAALATYLSDHAPRLRADGLARFGDRFRADRRVLEARANYYSKR